MYIYRAINSLDEELNPSEFGLISKEMINSIVEYYFDFLIYAESIRSGKNLLKHFSKEEVNNLYRDLRSSFVDGHCHEILRKAQQNQKILNYHLNNIISNKNSNSYEYVMSILKKINGHITQGSKIDYSWISFSTDPKVMKRYYDNQNKNRVVVVDSNIKTLFDNCGNDKLLAADLSNPTSIIENPFLINNNDYQTAGNYRGFNYARNSKEVIYYNMVPKEKIVAVLNSLEYELLVNNLLTELLPDNYYDCSCIDKFKLRILMLRRLSELFKDDGSIVNYILKEYYVESNSLKYLSEQGIYDLNKLNDANNYMLRKVYENKEKFKEVREYKSSK